MSESVRNHSEGLRLGGTGLPADHEEVMETEPMMHLRPGCLLSPADVCGGTGAKEERFACKCRPLVTRERVREWMAPEEPWAPHGTATLGAPFKVSEKASSV